MTQSKHPPVNAKIVRVHGHDGLPARYLVESKYGWLGADSFALKLEHARIFATVQSAIDEFKRQFPNAAPLEYVQMTPEQHNAFPKGRWTCTPEPSEYAKQLQADRIKAQEIDQAAERRQKS